MKILIVDDSPLNLKLLRAQLEAEKLDVLTAEDGLQALEVLKTQVVDGVISDILMPHMDGYQLCSEIRKSKKLKDLPLIIYTASYTSPSDEKLALDLGADLYLKKPASVPELMTALKEITKPGKSRSKPRHTTDDLGVMKNYNHVLVTKLEQKLDELEASNRKLKESDERFTKAFHESPVAMSLANLPERRIMDVNKAWCEMTGYSREEALATVGDELVKFPQEARDRMRSKVKNEGAILDMEVSFLNRRGQLVDLLFSLEPITIAGESCGLTTMVDITKRKQAERELLLALEDLRRETADRKAAQASLDLSQLRFASLVNSAMDAIISIDEEQNIVMFNSAAEKIFGYQKDEVLGRPLSELIPMRFREPHVEHVNEFARTGVSTRHMGALGAVSGLRKNGEEFPAEASISESAVNGQKFFSVILRDTTERLRYETRLEQSEERFNKAFQLSPVGMVLAKLSDNQILDINGAWCEITGYSREETLATPTADLVKIPPETIAKFVSEIDQHGSVRNMEVTVLAKAGHELVLLVSIELIKIGDLDCSLTTFVDITSRQKALEDLRESESLNRKLYEIADKRLRQTVALRSIDRAISNSLDLPFILEVVIDQAIKELSVDAADILLYNEITHVLTYAVGKGFFTSAPQEARVALGHGYAGKVILERKPFHISNLSSRKETAFDESSYFRMEQFEEFHCMPLIAKGKVVGVLETFARRPMEVNQEWIAYLETLAGQAAIAIENIALLTDLQRANNDLILGYDATIEGWSRALDLRDHETEGHTQRVTAMTVELARALNVGDQDIVNITRGALLHDIGKMGVPDAILLKPGKLTDEEWVLMRQHPELAFKLLSPIAYLKDALDIPYCHHEKWDGTGYPRGLKGAQIPFSARIFAIADVYDALTSERPYRTPWTKQQTLEYISEQAGTHFDPDVVRIFLTQQGFA